MIDIDTQMIDIDTQMIDIDTQIDYRHRYIDDR